MNNKSLEDRVSDLVMDFLPENGRKLPKGFNHKIMDRVERVIIDEVLKRLGGNQSRAAQVLEINRNTLRKKVVHHNIKVRDYISCDSGAERLEKRRARDLLRKQKMDSAYVEAKNLISCIRGL